MKNLVRPEQMPFDNITRKHFDSGDYPEALRARWTRSTSRACARARGAGEPDGRLIGIGLAIYCEQAAHGTWVYAGWGIPMVPGHEQATARMTPDGGLELRVGVHSHGQGMETTLAQVAHEILGIELAKISVVLGDTGIHALFDRHLGLAQHGDGGRRGRDRLRANWRASRSDRRASHAGRAESACCATARSLGPSGSVSLAEIAHTWYRRPQDLPADVDPRGLEATIGYKPERDTGTFSYAAHAATVAVDPEIGDVEILDYVIVEDGGMLVNPMVVDGQIYGGLAQGIGTALYEEMPFDAVGQPLASTFADYLLPGATEVPAPRIFHMETPSPYTEFGVKGIGEGGAIAPPAVIANAVNDALRPLGVELLHSPMTPRRMFEAIAAAGARRRQPIEDWPHEAGPFRLRRPNDLDGALSLIAEDGRPTNSWPAVNRSDPCSTSGWSQPDLLVDISGMTELRQVKEDGDGFVIGACVTHADIEDGRVPDVPAARCPASPQASPIARCATAARSAAASPMPIRRRTGSRFSPRSARRSRCAARTARARSPSRITCSARSRPLSDRAMLVSVKAPRLSRSARWGYYKICRKTGEFAQAIGAVVIDPERGVCRAVIGATETRPIVIADARAIIADGDARTLRYRGGRRVGEQPAYDPLERQTHVVALRRAVERAAARMSKVSLTVNGSALSAEVEPRTHLADFLRETHNLTGTHIGCEHGVCGACTLLVDGAPIRSCITFAVACEDADVTTIEGLDEDEIARELRAAFTAHHALQCGYCTPGMLVSARDIVLRLEAPSEHDIRVAMSGNLCRCTGYVGIVARSRASLPTGVRAALRPSPEAAASFWGRPDRGARANRTAPPTARRRGRSRCPTSRGGGCGRAHRFRLEAAGRIPAELRHRPPGRPGMGLLRPGRRRRGLSAGRVA